MLMRCIFCLLVIVLVSSGACGRIEESEKQADQLEKKIQEKAKKAIPKENQKALFRQSNSPYLGDLRTLAAPPPSLPPRVETRNGFSLKTESSLLPQEVTARISEATNIPAIVVLDPKFGANHNALLLNGQPIRYTGPLSDFLDQMSIHWDAAWEYRDGVIRIENTVTRIYEIRASAAISDFNLKTSDGDLETGSISTEIRVESTLWKEIESALASLVNPGRLEIAPGTGLVSITAPPSVHRKVTAYIDRANRIFDARILIEIIAAFLDVSNLDDFGISFNLIRAASSENGEITFGQLRTSSPNELVSFRVLEDAAGKSAQYLGSRALLQALSRSGRVVDYRTANAITRHGSPVPIRLARKQDIVRSVEVVTLEESTTTSIESETLDTGLSMSAYPRILDQDRVHLTLSLVSSDLIDLDDFSAGESASIQLATVDERRLTHDLVLESDETLLLAGYEQEKTAITHDGIGAPKFKLFGGSGRADTNRIRLFLIVSARVLR